MKIIKKIKKLFQKIRARIKKEIAVRKTMRQGYPRAAASRWYSAELRDRKLWRKTYSRASLEKAHRLGYLGRSIRPLGLMNSDSDGPFDRIRDLDYIYLRPLNNSFSKWIEDINTMTRMLPRFSSRLPRIYYSITKRGQVKILDYPSATRERTVKDIMACLRSAGEPVHLRPAFWSSSGARFTLQYLDENHVRADRKVITVEELTKLLERRSGNYLLCEKLRYDYPLNDHWYWSTIFKFFMVNDSRSSRCVTAVAQIFNVSPSDGRERLIDRTNGTFEMEGKTVAIPHWETISRELTAIAAELAQLEFFSVSVVLTEDGFKICSCSHTPDLPRIPYDAEMDEYLKGRVEEKRRIPVDKKAQREAFKNQRFARFVKKHCRKGIRPYMQRLWFDAVKSDLHYKGTTLGQKLWAWKRGFLSFRIEQYGLTEENYKQFLSDYDYHWLNRINNVYQAWISDKTTFRYTMEPMKEFIPDYYFSVFKRDGQVVLTRMPDCPDNIETSMEGVAALLRQEGILVFKPSAGTHGDGFYCLEYKEDKYWVNGEEIDEPGLLELFGSQRGFYLVTAYIHMHPELKKIYPKSVNSIRVMVINRHGYDPRIMQTYMRIGSSKTGYTDNVGYGGIAAMVNMDTGELYDPETLRDHVYYPCPRHPDTGTEIAGIVVPHWELVKKKVVEICQMMPELEYLGFDVAVTEDGFNVMEINIHQDLHKVGKHSEEIREYYRDRIAYKKKLYGIK